MLTRKQVLEQYSVDSNGIITSPGKFEGQMCYLPVIYEAFLNGDADDRGDYLSIVPTLEELQDFPELSSTDEIHFRITEQGFVEEI